MYETGVIIGGVGILFYFAILIVHTDNEHVAMRLFYLLTSVWLVVAITNLMLQVAIDDLASSAVTGTLGVIYSTSIWIAFVVSAYFVFYYIWHVLGTFNVYVKGKRGGGKR